MVAKGRQVSLNWWREVDLNHRPSGYEPDELPDCSIPLFCEINIACDVYLLGIISLLLIGQLIYERTQGIC